MYFINGKIHTMEGSNYESGYLHIVNGKIAEIGEMSDFTLDDEKIVDLKDQDVYPGFIDAHTHLGMFEDAITFEGDDGNEETEPLTPQLRALDAVNPMDRCFTEALEGGITTVVTGPGSANPVAGQMLAMKTYGRRIDDMVLKEPMAIKFALGENPKSVYHSKNQSPTTRMATAAVIREQLSKAKRYLEDQIKADQSPEGDYDPPERADSNRFGVGLVLGGHRCAADLCGQHRHPVRCRRADVSGRMERPQPGCLRAEAALIENDSQNK